MKISFVWQNTAPINQIGENGDEFLVYTGDTPKTVSEAMDISLEKWKLIVDKLNQIISDGLDPSDPSEANSGSDKTCGLCMMFLSVGCIGCPIYNRTGQDGCEGTPFSDYCDADDINSELVAAIEELKFLQEIKYDNNL